MAAPCSPQRQLLGAVAVPTNVCHSSLPAAPAPHGLRHHHPTLFDFAFERSLASCGRRFSASVFETRSHFDRSPA